MAARQDQTLQILSICLVGLVVVLGGFLIYVNRLKADYRQQLASAKEQSSKDANALRNVKTENESYLRMMGFDAFDNLTAVEEQFKQDMDKYSSSGNEEDKHYRPLIAKLDAQLETSANQESDAKRRLQQAEEQRKQELAQKDAQIAEYRKQVDATKADKTRLMAQFEQDRAAFEKSRGDLEQTIAQNRVQARKSFDDLQTKLATANEAIADRDAAIERFKKERQLEDPSFEISDGRITWVNQRNRTVWINVGESDSLRPQVTFSVFEKDLDDAGRSEKKGSIEVVRLLDSHLAEARITGDSIKDPIMPGDHIYSQVWHRGKQLHFALTGTIDLDGDGRNDIEMAKDLIRMNGGVLDSVLESDGSVTGKITEETRYLVLGDQSRPGESNAAQRNDGWDEMASQAKAKGVETITLQEFLNQMGYQPLDRTIGQGDNIKGSDYKNFDGKQFRRRSPYVPVGT